MKINKNIKYNILTIFILGFVTVNTHVAHANIRNRIVNFISNLCSSCLGRNNRIVNSGEEAENLVHNSVLDNLIFENNLKQSLNQIANKKSLVGRDAENFEANKVGNISLTKFYYQDKVGAEVKTLVSNYKPEVIGIHKSAFGEIVETEHTNPRGQTITMKNRGVPIWISGEVIVEEQKKRINNKVRRYFRSMEGVEPHNYYGTDESTILSSPTYINHSDSESDYNSDSSTTKLIK